MNILQIIMNSQSLEENDILHDSSYANCDIRKRQRSDKISNLMGQYLLKGWRMLNESCPKCEVSCIMLSNFVFSRLFFSNNQMVSITA